MRVVLVSLGKFFETRFHLCRHLSDGLYYIGLIAEREPLLFYKYDLVFKTNCTVVSLYSLFHIGQTDAVGSGSAWWLRATRS